MSSTAPSTTSANLRARKLEDGLRTLLSLSLSVFLSLYVYIYIYREREIERDTHTYIHMNVLTHWRRRWWPQDRISSLIHDSAEFNQAPGKDVVRTRGKILHTRSHKQMAIHWKMQLEIPWTIPIIYFWGVDVGVQYFASKDSFQRRQLMVYVPSFRKSRNMIKTVGLPTPLFVGPKGLSPKASTMRRDSNRN